MLSKKGPKLMIWKILKPIHTTKNEKTCSEENTTV